MAKRECIVGVRFEKCEMDFLKNKALQEKKYCFRNGSANLPGYIRSCVLVQSGWRKEMHVREVKELCYQIRKISVNINRVAAKINSGYQGMDAIRTLQENQEWTEQKLQELLDKLEGAHGSDEADAH